MKIDKKKLLKALTIVKPGLANKEMIEQSTSFAFLGDRVITYNDEISLSHPVEQLDMTGAVRAEELHNFLGKVKQDEIEMKFTESELLIKAGKSKAGLTFQADIKLPLDEIQTEKDWHDLPEEFTDNLMFIKDSASRDMLRRVLTCVHVTESGMETSDGFQIMRLFSEGWPFGSYLIPSENVSEIHKITPSQVAETEGWLHFRNLNGTELSCRVLLDKFPETSRLFEVDGNKIQFPKSMIDILERAMVFTKDSDDMDEDMEIKFKDNTLLVHGKNNYGWFKEEAKIKHQGDGGRFWISSVLLQNILKRSTVSVLSDDRIKFDGDGWEYIAVLKQG